MMAVDVRPGPPLALGQPGPLFELPPETTVMNLRFYEILPDGRFLVGVREETERSPRMTRLEVAQNCFAELVHLSPADQ